jgi:hypothetical protein
MVAVFSGSARSGLQSRNIHELIPLIDLPYGWELR